jgi:hypothetical protein
MRMLRPILAACLFLLLTGLVAAQPKPQEAILGKWVRTEKPKSDMMSKADIRFTLVFLKDGKYTGSVSFSIGGDTKSESFEGNYRFLDDKTIETTTINKTTERKEVNRLVLRSITAEELVLADPKGGQDLKFKKVKEEK